MGNSAKHERIQVPGRRRGSRSRVGHGDGLRAGQSPSGLVLSSAFQNPQENLASFVAGTRPSKNECFSVRRHGLQEREVSWWMMAEKVLKKLKRE